MAISYLKKASKTAASGETSIRARVEELLNEIELGGEERVRVLALELDKWAGDIVVKPQAFVEADKLVPEKIKMNYPEMSAGKIHLSVAKDGRITECGATVRAIASEAPLATPDTTACAMPASKPGDCCPVGTVASSCSKWAAPDQQAQKVALATIPR